MFQPTWATSRFIVSLSSPGAKKSLVWRMLILGYFSFYCITFLPWSQEVSGLVHVGTWLHLVLLYGFPPLEPSSLWSGARRFSLGWNSTKKNIDLIPSTASFGTYKFNVASPYLKQ